MVKKNKFTVEVDGEFIEVELEFGKDSVILYTPKKAIAKLKPVKQDEGVYLGLIDNRPHLFRWETNGVLTTLQTSEAIYQARVHKGALSKHKVGQLGEEITVRAPMSGIVTKVLKRDGSKVSKGMGVVVIEAMKMQNEVHTPTDGVVERVFVREGDSIKPGMPLFRIKST